MSALVYGAPCEPRRTLELPGLGPVDTGEPKHAGCPGGQTTPGLLGGWSCPCDCHRAPDPICASVNGCRCIEDTGHSGDHRCKHGYWLNHGEVQP